MKRQDNPVVVKSLDELKEQPIGTRIAVCLGLNSHSFPYEGIIDGEYAFLDDKWIKQGRLFSLRISEDDLINEDSEKIFTDKGIRPWNGQSKNVDYNKGSEEYRQACELCKQAGEEDL